MLRKILLVCGVVAPLLYVVTTAIAGQMWEGYSAASQAISELFAVEAPTKSFVDPPLTVYSLLVYAFGVGVWLSAGGKRTLRIAAGGIVAKEVLGLVAQLFFPMHLRGVEANFSDAMHVILTAVGVLSMLIAMGFGAAALGKQFRLYSIATFLVFLLMAILSFWDAGRMAQGLPTPWMGVWERILIYGYLLWQAVLAITLWRVQTTAAAGKPAASVGSPQLRPR
jgi:NO-binding membrane sensor protein with MHYT domain